MGFYTFERTIKVRFNTEYNNNIVVVEDNACSCVHLSVSAKFLTLVMEFLEIAINHTFCLFFSENSTGILQFNIRISGLENCFMFLEYGVYY